MLLPGCQCCGTCEECTRTCTEPHTGDAFEIVYTRKFEGAEAGNPSDGYLSATGDSDTSDPYNGMDGTGPWFQQVGGGFADGGSYGSGTRFPCTYRFSFWRSSYTLGVGTIPPASTALTENVIELTVSSGAVVFPDGRVITAADGAVAMASIPLVSGGASAVDPRTNEGTVSFALQCQNVETFFSVQARVRWNTQKRQHIVYGIVRECYEYPPNPCASLCGGLGKPSTVYVALTNLSFSNARYNYAGDGTSPGAADTFYTPAIISDWQSLLTSAVATTRIMNLCHQWQECLDGSGGLCAPCVGVAYKDLQYGYGGLTGVGGPESSNLTVYLMSTVNYGLPSPLAGCNEWVLIVFYLGDYDPCAPFDRSGSATGNGLITSNFGSYGGITFNASCDWRITS
jgi:hypothetical protein